MWREYNRLPRKSSLNSDGGRASLVDAVEKRIPFIDRYVDDQVNIVGAPIPDDFDTYLLGDKVGVGYKERMDEQNEDPANRLIERAFGKDVGDLYRTRSGGLSLNSKKYKGKVLLSEAREELNDKWTELFRRFLLNEDPNFSFDFDSLDDENLRKGIEDIAKDIKGHREYIELKDRLVQTPDEAKAFFNR